MNTYLPIEARQQQLMDVFHGLESWSARYEYIMQQGERLAPFPVQWRTARYRVHGCVSLLWLRGFGEPRSIGFSGASDCPMDAGLLALALGVYLDQPAEDIVASPPRFIRGMGLPNRISMNRLLGLEKVVEEIRRFALDRLLESRTPVTLNRYARRRRVSGTAGV